MNDLLTKGWVNASITKDRFVENFQERRARAEAGDIVQTIIIIAMFVLICVVVGGILYNAINAQAGKVSECITSANSGKCDTFKKP